MMHRLTAFALTGLVVICGLAEAAPAGNEGGGMDVFSAGVAVRDITPEPGIPLWGYSDRKGPATGTLDPLYAKALVLKCADKTVAMVSMDLGRTPLPEGIERIRARAKEAGVDYTFMAATHTHHGPVMESEAAYINKIETLVGDCIIEAAAKCKPAVLGVGRTTFDISHNRRIVTDDGKCLMMWRNEKKEPTAPVDKEAAVIRIDGEDGRPIAVLVNYACHPVIMGPSNLQYSADYVGELTRVVSEKTGALCMFFQGACGNINPYLDKTKIDDGAVEAMRGAGRECAGAVLEALNSIKPEKAATPAVDYVEKDVPVGVRWDLNNPQTVAILKKAYGEAFDRYVGRIQGELAVPLSVLMLNRRVAFVGMPGEIFVQYQRALKEGSPLKDTFLCGYANGFYGYFPTIRDAAAGGYGGTVATFVGLGAGDKLVAEAEIEIGKLTGKLSPNCTLNDFLMVDAPGQP